MAVNFLPVRASRRVIADRKKVGQIPEDPGFGQYQKTGIVGNQVQPTKLLDLLANPAISWLTLEGTALPTGQGPATAPRQAAT